MSVLRVVCHRHHLENSERRQLLALSGVWGGLDSLSAAALHERPVATMINRASAETTVARTVRELRELIAALDRRVPQVERVGEVSIARAAAALRAEALKRIEEVEREAMRDHGSARSADTGDCHRPTAENG